MIFSIVVPTYNHADTILETVESTLDQNFELEYEVLVVDNNSTDRTGERLARYNDRIRVLKNPRTVSLIENHNICLNEAHGDYIIFCHSDDRLLPDALANFYAKLKVRNFPEKYVLWGKSVFRDFQRNWEKAGLRLEQIASGEQIFHAFMVGGLTPSGTCYSRKSFLEQGGYVVTDTAVAPSDMVSMWRLILNGFQFEMSEKKFFIREFASTATERSRKEWTAAKTTAIRNFLVSCSEQDKEVLKKYISSMKDPNISTLLALRSNDLVTRLTVFRHLSARFLKKHTGLPRDLKK
ncbi:MAG: glycosyltransferase family 2 protein [Prolixibacteraceae bacterium]